MSHAVVIVNLGRMPDLVEDGHAEEGELPDKAYLEGRTFESNLLSDLMAPYDENTEVPRYRDYHSKREKASNIITVSKDWEKYTATLDVRFEPLPLAGRALYPDPSTVSEELWRESFERQAKAEEAIADLYTDAEVVDAYARYWGSGTDEKYFIDPDSKEETTIYRWSTYNPQSKWDWYVVGGRWSGALRLKRGGWKIVNTSGWDATYWQNDIGWGNIDAATIFTDDEKAAFNLPDEGQWVPAGGDVALARDVDWDAMFEGENLPGHAYLDEAEGWTENGKLIWFGMSTDGDKQQDEWRRKFRGWVDALPEDAVIAIVDYHI